MKKTLMILVGLTCSIPIWGDTIQDLTSTVGDYTYTYSLVTVNSNTTACIYGYHDSHYSYINGWSSLITPAPTNAVAIPSRLPYESDGLGGFAVTSIDLGAFHGCSAMTDLSMPDSVTNIGDCAFKDCSALTNIVLSANLKSLGWYSFYCCSKLEKIELPDTITDLSSGVFAECSGLKEMRLPRYITYIPSSFCPVTGLTRIAIPGNVSRIGESAFGGCAGLASVEFTPNSNLTVIEKRAFSGTALTDVVLPPTVTTIQEEAFAGCRSMTDFVMQNGVTTLGSSVFSRCSSLRSVTLSKNLTRISDGLFKDCANLDNVVIPEGVTDIGAEAFSGCVSLKSITIPNSVTTIAESAFSGCVSLESITIPNSVTTIAAGAFARSGLTRIDLPGSVTTLGGSAFYQCTNLVQIVIPDNVTAIGRGAFGNCTALESARLGNGIDAIPDRCFSGCTALISVAMSDDTWKIGDGAFMDCSSLEHIDLPDSVSDIGTEAFKSSNLKSVSLPPCVTLGRYAFSYTKLTEVRIPRKVDSLDSTFWGCADLTNVVLECGYTTISESGTDVEILEGASSLHWTFLNCESLKSINLPPTIRDISSAFERCSSLEAIELPPSVTNISGAFSYCSSLDNVVIPESVRDLGGSTFMGCTSMSTIIIPNSVTNIGDYAFTFNNYSGEIIFGNPPPAISYRTFYCSHPSKVTCLGGLPTPSSWMAGSRSATESGSPSSVGKYVVTAEYLHEWLPWFIANKQTNYAVLDEATQSEADVVFIGDGKQAVGVSAALGVAPARLVSPDDTVTLVYESPKLSITAFDPKSGRVDVLVEPGEGGAISGDIVTECVMVEWSDDLSDWKPTENMTVDAADYRKDGQEGRFVCIFDASIHPFYRVKVLERQ